MNSAPIYPVSTYVRMAREANHALVQALRMNSARVAIHAGRCRAKYMALARAASQRHAILAGLPFPRAKHPDAIKRLNATPASERGIQWYRAYREAVTGRSPDPWRLPVLYAQGGH